MTNRDGLPCFAERGPAITTSLPAAARSPEGQEPAGSATSPMWWGVAPGRAPARTQGRQPPRGAGNHRGWSRSLYPDTSFSLRGSKRSSFPALPTLSSSQGSLHSLWRDPFCGPRPCCHKSPLGVHVSPLTATWDLGFPQVRGGPVPLDLSPCRITSPHPHPLPEQPPTEGQAGEVGWAIPWVKDSSLGFL